MDLAIIGENTNSGGGRTAFVERHCHRSTRWLLPQYKSLLEEEWIKDFSHRYKLADIKSQSAEEIRAQQESLCRVLCEIGLKETRKVLFVSVGGNGSLDNQRPTTFLELLPSLIGTRFSTTLHGIVGMPFVQRRFQLAKLPIRTALDDCLPKNLREDAVAQRMLALPAYIGFLLIGGVQQACKLIALSRSFSQGYRFYGTYRKDPRIYVVLVA